MDKRDLESLMEKYKKEMLEISKKKTIKDEAKAKIETPKVNSNPKYTTEQRGAGKESETQDKIEPLEQEVNKDNGNYALESMNEENKPQTKTRLANSDEIPIVGNMTKKNTDSAKKKYREYEKELTQSGTLRIETVSSYGLYPVSNVHVVVFKEFDGENYYIYDRYTDGSGIIKDLVLPAPSKAYSQTPDNDGVLPYATYNIYVEHPNFVNLLYENVPVFDSVISIQGAEMIPSLDSTEPRPTLIIEKEPMGL